MLLAWTSVSYMKWGTILEERNLELLWHVHVLQELPSTGWTGPLVLGTPFGYLVQLDWIYMVSVPIWVIYRNPESDPQRNYSGMKKLHLNRQKPWSGPGRGQRKALDDRHCIRLKLNRFKLDMMAQLPHRTWPWRGRCQHVISELKEKIQLSMILAATNMMVVAISVKANHMISNELKISDALAVTWPEQFWDVLSLAWHRVCSQEKRK